MSFPVLFLCFLIGCVAGLRSLMAPAIVCAAAYLQWVHLQGTPLAFMTNRVTLWILTFLAICELIVDKLPQTPARTAPMGLVARAVTGGLSGAALAAGGGKSLAAGTLLGAAGGVAGAFAGFEIRRGLTAQMKLPDFVVAVVEDLLTISGGLFVVSRM